MKRKLTYLGISIFWCCLLYFMYTIIEKDINIKDWSLEFKSYYFVYGIVVSIVAIFVMYIIDKLNNLK